MACSSSSCSSTAIGQDETSSSRSSSSSGGCSHVHVLPPSSAPVASTQVMNLLLELVVLLGQSEESSSLTGAVVGALGSGLMLAPVEEHQAFLSARGPLLLQALWLLGEQGSREQQEGDSHNMVAELWPTVVHFLTADTG